MLPFADVDPAVAVTLTILATLAALARAWLVHRATVRREEEHTERTRIAVAGSASEHRADVVRACADLEAAALPTADRRRGRAPSP